MPHSSCDSGYPKAENVVVYYLIRRKIQVRHQNKIQKVFFPRFPLSRFLAKTLRVNKIAMKNFSKNLSFGVDFKL